MEERLGHEGDEDDRYRVPIEALTCVRLLLGLRLSILGSRAGTLPKAM